ncbi:MAG: DUF2007 domain-containing protein [Chloroflexi bacterium]|jgi:hypothetical protein|nr:DUF2007 domain-containing protein [Chloroflexota bacterium]
MNDEELLLVYVSQGPLGAEVVRTKLEAENIPVVLRFSALGRALGLTFNGLGQVEVWVRPADAAEARDLLAEEDEDLGTVVPGQAPG